MKMEKQKSSRVLKIQILGQFTHHDDADDNYDYDYDYHYGM